MPEGNFTGWSDPESSREVFPADGMAELRPGGKVENGILAIGRDQHYWRVGLLRAAGGKERPDPRRPHIPGREVRT